MCQFIDCKLRDSNDCGAVSSTWSGGHRIKIDEEWPAVELEMEDYDYGYSYDICLRCTNGQLYSDVVSFTVTVDANPCASVLSDVSLGDYVELPFRFEQPLVSFTPTSSFVDWDTFFLNTDPTNCPITSCDYKWGYLGFSCT